MSRPRAVPCPQSLLILPMVNMQAQIYILLSLASLLQTIRGACQYMEPWRLETHGRNPLGTVVFKNLIGGKRQSMSWAWSTSETESWQNKINQNDIDGSMEGLLTYRKMKNDEKTNVHVQWKLNGDDFSSVRSNKKIYNTTWDLSTWNGLSMTFRANHLGDWELTVQDDYKITNDQDFDSIEVEPIPFSRRKRAEVEVEAVDPNVDILQAGILDCLMDFFFGEGDEMTGRTEGIFTKMKNWFKGVACRFRGDCTGVEEGAGGQPLPNFPLIPAMIPLALPSPFDTDETRTAASGGGGANEKQNSKNNDVETF